jgi:ubiquinone/menaquinone biosynthesis C-methylase UbiE
MSPNLGKPKSGKSARVTDVARGLWYKKAFGPIYLELYGHRDESEAGRAVQVLSDHLPGTSPPAGVRKAPVLDIACGAGRYLGALQDAGVPVVGLDLSLFLLKHAWRRAPGRVVRGDMRRLPFRDGAFAAAISMFTSFGYFKKLDENQDVLNEAHRVVKGSGGLAIDYLNVTVTLANLVPENERTVGRYHVVERRQVDPGPDGVDRIVKTMIVTEEARHVETLNEEVMVLSPERLERLVEEAGFQVIDRLGDYEGRPFDPATSPRCLLICRRVP